MDRVEDLTDREWFHVMRGRGGSRRVRSKWRRPSQLDRLPERRELRDVNLKARESGVRRRKRAVGRSQFAVTILPTSSSSSCFIGMGMIRIVITVASVLRALSHMDALYESL